MTKKIKCIVLMVTLAMVSSQVFAATLLNGGFEAPAVTAWTNLDSVTNSWDYSDGGGAGEGLVNQNNATHCPNLSAAEGTQFAFIWCGSANNDKISQTVDGFISGNDYPIVWSEAGRIASGAGGALEVRMNDTVICTSHSIPADETFRQTNVTFTATATSHTLIFINSGGWDKEIFIDNVQILPEPATFGLLALFGLAFLCRK